VRIKSEPNQAIANQPGHDRKKRSKQTRQNNQTEEKRNRGHGHPYFKLSLTSTTPLTEG